MIYLSSNLVLGRCPHCSVANPLLNEVSQFPTNDHEKSNPRHWKIYVCATCGGVVSAWTNRNDGGVGGYHPVSLDIDESIPERPRTYLKQAHESLHAPAGAVMLAASAVDSMLKFKNYVDGSLYSRIERAVAENVITSDMGAWAHAVRLDANDQRHADESANLPTMDDARRVLDFARTFAEVLFVLPSRIASGMQS